MSFKVEPFRADHLAELKVQSAQMTDLHWQETHKLGRELGAGYRQFTVRDAAGRVIFCGGAMERHANYASLWALFADEKREGLTFLWRRTRRFIEGLPHRRVDALVPAGHLPAQRFAKHVGLVSEACMRAAAPDGGDMLIFVRETD